MFYNVIVPEPLTMFFVTYDCDMWQFVIVICNIILTSIPNITNKILTSCDTWT